VFTQRYRPPTPTTAEELKALAAAGLASQPQIPQDVLEEMSAVLGDEVPVLVDSTYMPDAKRHVVSGALRTLTKSRILVIESESHTIWTSELQRPPGPAR
jgi:hypothetical protein